MSEQMRVLLVTTYGMSFPPSPTQFAVPSGAGIPAVIPKGGISDVSIEPEEPEDDEVVEGTAVPTGAAMAAVVAAVVTVTKVLGEIPPPPP